MGVREEREIQEADLSNCKLVLFQFLIINLVFGLKDGLISERIAVLMVFTGNETI